MRAVLIDWCRTQILELHYTFKGYISCTRMCVVILTVILLTGHDHIALINFLSICLQTTTNHHPPPFHPQLRQGTNSVRMTQKAPKPVFTSFNKRKLTTKVSYCRRKQFVCFLLGNSTTSEFYMPTFRNTLSVPSS